MALASGPSSPKRISSSASTPSKRPSASCGPRLRPCVGPTAPPRPAPPADPAPPTFGGFFCAASRQWAASSRTKNNETPTARLRPSRAGSVGAGRLLRHGDQPVEAGAGPAAVDGRLGGDDPLGQVGDHSAGEEPAGRVEEDHVPHRPPLAVQD